ncbi:hypothetical protein JB92DRAFT_3097149 [Gautieria morchelliformis]|nr:hypothetical protein JB92DRAFT_3097149 [Gautieria morchelliformis]
MGQGKKREHFMRDTLDLVEAGASTAITALRANYCRRDWSQDITTLNAHYGDETSLNALSKAQQGCISSSTSSATAWPPPHCPPALICLSASQRNSTFIADFNNQTDVEQCSLGDTNVALVDLNSENHDVINGTYSWINQTVQIKQRKGRKKRKQ